MVEDDDFLKYMRVKTINQFNQKNLLIGVPSPVKINTGDNTNINPVPPGPPNKNLKPDKPKTPSPTPPNGGNAKKPDDKSKPKGKN